MQLDDGVQAASFSMSSSLLVKAVMVWEHDGGVIKRGARVNACGVFRPLCVETVGFKVRSTTWVGMGRVEAVTIVLGHVYDYIFRVGHVEVRHNSFRGGRTAPIARTANSRFIRLRVEFARSSQLQAARGASLL